DWIGLTTALCHRDCRRAGRGFDPEYVPASDFLCLVGVPHGSSARASIAWKPPPRGYCRAGGVVLDAVVSAADNPAFSRAFMIWLIASPSCWRAASSLP